MFKTTPIEPLHNLIGIPPIPYLVNKLMHTYSNRLRGLPPNATVHTVLTYDQCHYWPDYAHPTMNLTHASANLGPPMYRPLGLCTAGFWEHPHLIYLPNPPLYITMAYKQSMECHEASDTHIFIYHLV